MVSSNGRVTLDGVTRRCTDAGWSNRDIDAPFQSHSLTPPGIPAPRRNPDTTPTEGVGSERARGDERKGCEVGRGDRVRINDRAGNDWRDNPSNRLAGKPRLHTRLQKLTLFGSTNNCVKRPMSGQMPASASQTDRLPFTNSTRSLARLLSLCLTPSKSLYCVCLTR